MNGVESQIQTQNQTILFVNNNVSCQSKNIVTHINN